MEINYWSIDSLVANWTSENDSTLMKYGRFSTQEVIFYQNIETDRYTQRIIWKKLSWPNKILYNWTNKNPIIETFYNNWDIFIRWWKNYIEIVRQKPSRRSVIRSVVIIIYSTQTAKEGLKFRKCFQLKHLLEWSTHLTRNSPRRASPNSSPAS